MVIQIVIVTLTLTVLVFRLLPTGLGYSVFERMVFIIILHLSSMIYDLQLHSVKLKKV